jgi:hypothetical protein
MGDRSKGRLANPINRIIPELHQGFRASKTKNYQTNPFRLSDFPLQISHLCRFPALRIRKTNPFCKQVLDFITSPSVVSTDFGDDPGGGEEDKKPTDGNPDQTAIGPSRVFSGLRPPGGGTNHKTTFPTAQNSSCYHGVL